MIVLPVEKQIDWKRPPIVLFGLIIINILVFAFYQSDDNRLMQVAVDTYQEENLQEIEWAAFEDYQESLEFDQRVDLEDGWVVWYMVMDEDFERFIEENQDKYIDEDMQQDWRASRTEVKEVYSQLSHKSFGLNTDNISLLTVLSHQFLHGDIGHLLGNMVFLVLTGFAVEAALGHLRFLFYYLVSGVCAGLLYAGVHIYSGGSNASLVGASGAISGVMAMYLTLFKMRKIEFFYWLFIFTGYFRAAAIIVLPAYILKELVMQFMYEGSNVAYTAHIGGFVAGLVLVMATQVFKREVIDDDYLEGVEAPVDPYRKELNKLYQVIAKCEFRQAWSKLKVIKQKYPAKVELQDIEYNLLLALDRNKASKYLMSRLGRSSTSQHLIKAQISAWQVMDTDQQAQLSFEKKGALIANCLSVGSVHVAEKIFSGLSPVDDQRSEAAVFARRIAMYYQELGRADIAAKHNQVAQKIMDSMKLSPATGVA